MYFHFSVQHFPAVICLTLATELTAIAVGERRLSRLL